MARGFGTTFGVASTDRIQTSLTTNSLQRSWACWTWARAASVNASIFDKSNAGVQLERIQESSDGSLTYEYKRAWSLASGGIAAWGALWPPTGQWVHVVMTYDGSSASNVPGIYFNGLPQTVSVIQAAAGTISTNTDSYWIGNRGNGDRGWDGMLAEAAIWDRILNPVEIKLIAGGWSPSLFQAGLVEYVPLDGTIESKARGPWKPVTTGTLWQPHPNRIIGPSKDLHRFMTSAVAAPTVLLPWQRQGAMGPLIAQ